MANLSESRDLPMLRSDHSLLCLSAAEAAEIVTPVSDILVTPGVAHNQTDDHCAETIVIQNRMLTPYLCKSTHLMVHITLGIADMISPPILFVVLTFHPVRTHPSQNNSYKQKIQSRYYDDPLFITCDFVSCSLKTNHQYA